MEPVRKCAKCEEEKDLTEFYKSGTKFKYTCKACTSEINKTKYKKHPDRAREYQKRYQKMYRDSEKGRAKAKAYREANSKKMAEYQRIYRCLP